MASSSESNAGITPSAFPAQTRTATALINNISTVASRTLFSDKILITVTQGGKLAHWVRTVSIHHCLTLHIVVCILFLYCSPLRCLSIKLLHKMLTEGPEQIDTYPPHTLLDRPILLHKHDRHIVEPAHRARRRRATFFGSPSEPQAHRDHDTGRYHT